MIIYFMRTALFKRDPGYPKWHIRKIGHWDKLLINDVGVRSENQEIFKIYNKFNILNLFLNNIIQNLLLNDINNKGTKIIK